MEKTITNPTKKRSQLGEVWRRLKKNKLAMLGLAVLIFLSLLAIFADVLFDYEEVAIKQDYSICLQKPSKEHWLGTDEFGRDILARIVHGSRISLSVGIVSVFFGLCLGGPLGAIAGYFGGAIDNIIMRFVDILLAVPTLLLQITIVAALGSSMFNLMFAIAIGSIPSYARVVRSSVMTLKDSDFVESARAIGATNFEIIMQHIIPNCLAPIIVQVSLKVAGAILATSSLSFLGLGIKAPTPEWGSMLSSGREYMRKAMYMTVFPGLAIVTTILSLNLLGDGLRDALDPKLKK